MNRSVILDVLRIFAIFLVFIAHFGQLLGHSAGDFFGIKNFYYVSLGGVGVSLFLILSGILAGLSGFKKRSSYTNYLLKKVLRIYPLYWMSAILAVMAHYWGAALMNNNTPKLFPNGALVDILGSFSGFYTWMGLWGGPYNSPSWFIALIMVMYALFPLIYFALKRQASITLLVTLFISLVSRYYIGQEGLPFDDMSIYGDVRSWVYRKFGFMPGRPVDWFPLCRLFEFTLGAYLAIKLPTATWLKLQLPLGNKGVALLSDLSFPLFLLHYPFLFLIVYMQNQGLPTFIAITFYIGALVFVAYFLNMIDNYIPRKQLLQGLFLNTAKHKE